MATRACRCRSSSPGFSSSTCSTSCSAGPRAARAPRRLRLAAADADRLPPRRQPPGPATSRPSGRRWPDRPAGLTLAIFALAPIAPPSHGRRCWRCSPPISSAPPRPAGLSRRRVVVTYALPQRDAAGGDDARHGLLSFLLGANVLVEKVFAWPGVGSYAVEALIASDFAPVQLRPGDGAALHGAEPDDRPRLRADRPAGPGGRMSATGSPALTPARPRSEYRRRWPMPAPSSPQPGHGLRLRACSSPRRLRVLGPSLVPYDPLASERPPRSSPVPAHPFGTDQLGATSSLSRVVVAGKARPRHRGALVGARLRRRRACRDHGRVSSAAGPTGSSGVSPTPSWPSALRPGDGDRRGARNTVGNIVLATAIINFPL